MELGLDEWVLIPLMLLVVAVKVANILLIRWGARRNKRR